MELDVTDKDRKRNLFADLTSNYDTVFRKSDDVRTETIGFKSDSMRLGDDAELLLQECVSDFDADTDLLSIVGCSHGETTLANGNALLANGRANRVKEVFLYSGLPADALLDEACWDENLHTEGLRIPVSW